MIDRHFRKDKVEFFHQGDAVLAEKL